MNHIKKGTKLIVRHKYYGSFHAISAGDFSTMHDNDYSLALDQNVMFAPSGAFDFKRGDIVPCERVNCVSVIFADQPPKKKRGRPRKVA